MSDSFSGEELDIDQPDTMEKGGGLPGTETLPKPPVQTPEPKSESREK